MVLPGEGRSAYAGAMVSFFRVAALLLLAAITYATLVPIGLRPHAGGVDFERFGAYAALGLCLALGFPRRLWPAVLLVTAAAIGLELLQLVDPTRHGRLPDALVKLAGGLAGVLAGAALQRLLRPRAAARRLPR